MANNRMQPPQHDERMREDDGRVCTTARQLRGFTGETAGALPRDSERGD
jgi:hypothetical protein